MNNLNEYLKTIIPTRTIDLEKVLYHSLDCIIELENIEKKDFDKTAINMHNYEAYNYDNEEYMKIALRHKDLEKRLKIYQILKANLVWYLKRGVN